MATIQIDRLLETVVRRGASDLHLACGKPPTIRLHGHLRELQTKVLDPEDTMSLMKSIIVQREIGVDVPNFAESIRRALRQDPDVMLVGEMRDLATISSAITAAETGHLVFGTLHTSSAPKTIDRIIDVFPAGQQNQIRTMVSESLEAVVAQTLVKRKGGGRIAACEILIGAPAVRNLIREGKLHQIPSIMQTSQRLGMQTLDLALADLMKRGLIEQCALPPRPPGLNGGAAAGAAA